MMARMLPFYSTVPLVVLLLSGATSADDVLTSHRCCFGTPLSGPRTLQGPDGGSCNNCHRDGETSRRVREDEFSIWNEDDKHRQAYKVLSNERSEQMARILGIVDSETGASLIHRDARCLACHSSGPLDHPDRDGDLLPAAIEDDSRFRMGVSCESCHGAAGSRDDGWIGPHHLYRKDVGWEQLTAKEKFERYGYWDVRDSRTQAKICLSCHVGNVEQGKVLTHEMYAAGHPPLSGFEMNAFVHQQPRHWHFVENKPPDVRDAIFAERGEEFDSGSLYRTEALLVSSLQGVCESLELVADLIDTDVQRPISKPTWPELASYSCFACHHELQRDGWRKSRPLTPTPGRPVLQEWPFAMGEVAADISGHNGEFHERLAELYGALDRRPFGRPDELSKVCREFAAATDRWSIELQSGGISTEQGKAILGLITNKGANQVYDYDSARQLVWAYEGILHDLQRQQNRMTTEVSLDARPGWAGWLVRHAPLSRQEEILKRLDSVLLLDLRAGTKAGDTEQPNAQQGTFEVDLHQHLHLLSRYHPQIVREAFQGLLSPQP